MIHVKWVKARNGGFLPFENFTVGGEPLSSNSLLGRGVYVIGRGSSRTSPPTAVYVGQGNIADRLLFHRSNKDVLKHRKDGILLVTWANLQESQLDGVEHYLADKLFPRAGDRWPLDPKIAVNLPW